MLKPEFKYELVSDVVIPWTVPPGRVIVFKLWPCPFELNPFASIGKSNVLSLLSIGPNILIEVESLYESKLLSLALIISSVIWISVPLSNVRNNGRLLFP